MIRSTPSPTPHNRRTLSAILLGCLLAGLLLTAPVLAQDGPMLDNLPTPTPLPTLNGPLLAGAGPDSASLFLYDLSTGIQRDLNFGEGRHWMGSFAPDGCRFAFVLSDGDGRNMRLYSARLDGSDMQPLVNFTDTSGAESWEAWGPRWSPAGDRIAFILIRDYVAGDERERTTHLAVIPATGGTPTLYSISGTEGAQDWSPDGQWLVYTSFELGAGGQREADLWIVSADGGTKYQLTDFAAGSTHFPQWSPNGTVISFIYAPSGNNHQFWTAPASGGAVQQWSETWTVVLGYDWLPDGTGLVSAIKNWQGVDDNLLWRVPLPGFADTDATRYLDHPEVTAVDFPTFSPDGRYLAFRTAYSAAFADTVTGEVRLVESAGLNNSPLAWSPPAFAGETACP